MQYLFRYSTNLNKNRVLVAIAESKQKASWQKQRHCIFIASNPPKTDY